MRESELHLLPGKAALPTVILLSLLYGLGNWGHTAPEWLSWSQLLVSLICMTPQLYLQKVESLFSAVLIWDCWVLFFHEGCLFLTQRIAKY